MKKIISLFLVLNLCFCGRAQQSQFAAEADQLILPLVETNNYSGSLLISHKGKRILARSYGKMSREFDREAQLDSKFFLASVSMIFTSAAVMKLVERGQISLEDKLSQYFPEYKHAEKMSIHHLLAQRSGIPAIGAEANVDYDSMTKFIHTPAQLYAYFQDYDLLYSPGERYNHGRSEYILLALLIERISGKSFGSFLQDEIFRPLGMENSGHFEGEQQIISSLSTGYAAKDLYEVEKAYQIDWSSKTGHASIYSTVEDLQLFAEAILDNRLLTAASWEKVLQNHGQNVGYGWFIRDHLNRKRFQMNGRSPGFSSYLAIYPDEKLIVVVLSNNYISLPYDIGQNLAALVLKEATESLNLSTKAIDKEQLKQLVGYYQFSEDFYRPNFKLNVREQDGKLYTDWGALVPIDEGSTAFQKFILRTYWSSIEFIRNKEGEFVKMKFDRFEGEKVSN